MRIQEVSVETLDIPFREVLVGAGQRWERRRVGLLRVVADDGSEGLGELAAQEPSGLGEAADRLPGLRAVLERVDAADPRAVEGALLDIDARSSLGRPARSAAESAIVDLLARAQGVSVARSLAEAADGAPAAEVPVNALVGIGAPDVVAVLAARLVAAGFHCLKLKCDREEALVLIERVAAVRDAVGPNVAIRLDFNGALEPSSAPRLLVALEPFDIDYVEQPIPAHAGVAELAALRTRTALAIAADETVSDLGSAEALLAAQAVDVLVVKPARVGGIREARRIVDRASAAGVRATISTLYETGVGIAAALHLAATVPGGQAHGLATADLLTSDLLLRSLAVVGGHMAVPVGPGLGIRLDPLAVERFRVA